MLVQLTKSQDILARILFLFYIDNYLANFSDDYITNLKSMKIIDHVK